jgi:lipopolysaccharide cholinephosphotransferase
VARRGGGPRYTLFDRVAVRLKVVSSAVAKRERLSVSLADLSEIQAAQARALEDLSVVLDAHGFDFYLDAGTLLGAVRSKGWIPWDDDIDILMFRDEYERFSDVADQILPPQLKLSCPWRSADHISFLPRISLAGTSAFWEERCGIRVPDRQQLAIDIFIADVAPESPLIRKSWARTSTAIAWLSAFRATTVRRILTASESAPVKGLAISALIVSRVVPLRVQKQGYRFVARAWRNSRSPFLAMLNHGSDYRSIPVRREWFVKKYLVAFEGRKYPAPDALPYLRSQYGEDFLQEPPEHMRYSHGFKEVHLPDGA